MGSVIASAVQGTASLGDAEQPVLCPHCENVVGTGLDFGVGKGYK